MLNVLRCVFLHTVKIVLWKKLWEPVNALDSWWPCTWLKCVSGLGWLEKNLNFLRCIHIFDLVLKFGSDINEGNWLQLLLHFTVLVGKNASVIRMKFFVLCFRFSIEVFLYCALTETFANGFPKLFGHEWIDFVFFCSWMAFFVEFISLRTEICNGCSIVFFWWHRYVWCLVWGVFGLLFKVVFTFQP